VGEYDGPQNRFSKGKIHESFICLARFHCFSDEHRPTSSHLRNELLFAHPTGLRYRDEYRKRCIGQVVLFCGGYAIHISFTGTDHPVPNHWDGDLQIVLFICIVEQRAKRTGMLTSDRAPALSFSLSMLRFLSVNLNLLFSTA
jgi:hypothetical protein